MQIKAVFLDMDGTLLRSDNTISHRTREAVARLKQQGVHVFLATGRHLDITLPYHRELDLDTPIICLNGAAVYDSYSLDPLQLRPLPIKKELHQAVMAQSPRNLMIHSAEGLYCEKECSIIQEWSREGRRAPLYAGPITDALPSTILKYSVRSFSHLTVPSSLYRPHADMIRWDDGFELVRSSVSKWAAIEYLLYQYGIHKRESLAFGDGPNDMEMLLHCGTGVAMANAGDLLKQNADFVTMHHEADGVARFLEGFVLKNHFPAPAAALSL
ncbi:HAD family hydrolase [Alkalicoccus urumqiensis]|uniref:Cof-type HAD-IIB family hydrolase n=1 Tax=Alkalicoccus urumqiensis TaxID=1548213 RepID=A0A2P6MI09_ALKUR|nr:HAD family hydrolase [Alkalicoccus urumqiensis]PRO65925.1 Cof-type HAD-IIB family hydrolase [Alkalicoccus urumqiensis]